MRHRSDALYSDVLYTMRSFAQATGECWASNHSIAVTIGCCVRTVQRAKRWLEERGEIIQVYGREVRTSIFNVWALDVTRDQSYNVELANIPNIKMKMIRVAQKIAGLMSSAHICGSIAPVNVWYGLKLACGGRKCHHI